MAFPLRNILCPVDFDDRRWKRAEVVRSVIVVSSNHAGGLNHGDTVRLQNH
jgi:hypothetical protein